MNFNYLESHAVNEFVRNVKTLVLQETSTRTLMEHHVKKISSFLINQVNCQLTKSSCLINNMHKKSINTEQLSGYLANRTYAFAFPTYTFPGLGALQSMFTVGTLPTVHWVVASNTLSTRDPLWVERTRIEKQVGLFSNAWSYF